MQADTVRFEYDRSGWLTAEHAGNGSICYQRDALGNPTDITLPDGQHLTHLYYGSGHLLQTALDGLTVSEYERDSLHRQIMRTQGQLATYSGYDDDGLLSWQRSLASGSALFFWPAPGAAGLRDVEGLLLEQPRRGGHD